MYLTKKSDRTYLPWNKDRLIGQKLPLTLKQIWAIRMSLQTTQNLRDLALFNLAIDSKLRACDLLRIKVSDVCSEGHGESAGYDRPTKDTETRQVRDYGPNQEVHREMGPDGLSERLRLSITQAGKEDHATCRCDSTRE